MAGEDDDDLDITLDAGDDDQQVVEEDEGETVIAFADETEDEDEEEAPPLVKRLRDELRAAQGQLAKFRRTPPTAANEGDPEPTVPEEPGALETFDYDEDKQREAWRAHREAAKLHEEWKARQTERATARNREADRQAKTLEQQRSSLGVSDYEERAALVKDRLTEEQIAVLINGAQNPSKLIYALGRSPTKLDQLAGEGNLARFAMMCGGMERDIKVMKRNAPAADTRVRGATATSALSRVDKELERLEKEADRTNDRSKVIAYKRAQREAQKAA